MRALDNPKMRSSCRYLLIYFYRCNIARMPPQRRSISEHLCCSIHRYGLLYIYGVGPLFERLPTAFISFVKQGFQSLFPFQPKISFLTVWFSRKKRVDDTEECDGETLRTPAKLRRCDSVVEAVKAAESKAGECECEMINL